MKVQIQQYNIEYEIQLEQITQLGGVDFEKKNYIIQSLYKYFSNRKYALYEEQMVDNILLEGKKVGRKYFNISQITCRENLISAIKISKSSLMMDYLTEKYTEFQCQTFIEKISNNLEQLYKEINKGLQQNMNLLEISYNTKDLMEIIQASEILGVGEEPLEKLSNTELLDMYIELLWEVQRKNPVKELIIIENIDHMLCYNSYKYILNKVKQFCNEFDIWFIFSTSIEGFMIVDELLLEGINIINQEIFSFPIIDNVFSFVHKHYPCNFMWDSENFFEELRMIIQHIGDVNYSIHLKSNVILKLFQNSLCISSTVKSDINLLEKSFIMT